MKSFNTELEKYAKKIRLKAAERAEVRERILTYMEYHPLPGRTRAPAKRVAVSSRFVFVLTHTMTNARTRIAAGAFVVLFVAVGVPFAAERAVPGDILYPVKTQINEEWRAQFVDSPYEKIAFETELMNRRIAEARLLEKEGRLSEAVEAQIAETVKGHATAAWEGIAELNATDAEEGAIAKITFGSALEVQSAIFREEGEGDNVTTGIAGVMNAARASVDADTSTSTTRPSYERLSAHVEQNTTRAYELFASVETSATDGERAKIERRLSDIERKVAKAQEVRGDEGVALLSEALADIQKLISFMTDIDVRENVGLDELVPVVLTPEERIAALEEKLSEQAETEVTSEDTATSTENGFVTELKARIAEAKTLLTEGKVKEAESVIEAAEALRVDDPIVSEEDVVDGETNASSTTEVELDADLSL